MIDTELYECDYVVIGSGAGGAPVSYELAKAGFKVIIMEEGENFSTNHSMKSIPECISTMFRNNGGYPVFGNVRFPVIAGCCVGGSTTVSNGTCIRTPVSVINFWKEALNLRELTLDFDNYLNKIEIELGIIPIPEEIMGKSGLILKNISLKKGLSSYPISRYAPHCTGKGLCCFGCPTKAKRSMDNSFIPMAVNYGAQLLSNTKANTIITKGNMAVGIDAASTNEKNKRIRIFAQNIIVSCGALLSPILLVKSGLISRFSFKSLFLQPCIKVMAKMKDEVFPWVGTPQSYAVNEYEDHGIIIESIQVPSAIGANSFGALGEEHKKIMENYKFICSLVAIIKDENPGKLIPALGHYPMIFYNINNSEKKKLNQAVKIMSELLLESGAEEIYLPEHNTGALSRNKAYKILDSLNLNLKQLILTSYHPMSSMRITSDNNNYKVNQDFKLYGTDNIYIMDASILPTSLGCNPQMTLMALSMKLADKLINKGVNKS